MTRLLACEFRTLDGVMEASEQWQPSFVSTDFAGRAESVGLPTMELMTPQPELPPARSSSSPRPE